MVRRGRTRRSGVLVGLVIVTGLLGWVVLALRSESTPALAGADGGAAGRPDPGPTAPAPETAGRPVATDAHAARPLALPGESPVAFSTVSGRIVDRAGAGIPRATVELVPPGFMVFFAPRHEVRTDTNGDWTAERMTGGRWRVRAWADGYLPPRRRSIAVPPASAVERIDFVLASDTRIVGQLRDADGRPLTGQFVRLVGPTGSERIDRTRANGHFDFNRLSRGAWHLSSWPGGGQTVTLAQGETARVQLALRRSPRVRGRVLRGGVPVPDAWVAAHLLEVAPDHDRDRELLLQTALRPAGVTTDPLEAGAVTTRVRTDGLGEFDLEPPYAPGSYALVATLGGALTLPSVAHVDWDDEELVDLAFGDGLVVGRVVSTLDGRPVPRVDLVAIHRELGARWPAALPTSGLFRTSVRSDDAGRFRIEGLTPGRYRVEVDDGSYLAGSSRAVDVPAGGEATEVRLEVTLGATLAGAIHGSGGALPGGTVVRLESRDGRREVLLARVDKSRRYQFVGLEAGTYEAVVCGRRQPTDRSHEPLVEATTIHVTPGGRRQLDFHVEGSFQPPPPEPFQLELLPAGTRRP